MDFKCTFRGRIAKKWMIPDGTDKVNLRVLLCFGKNPQRVFWSSQFEVEPVSPPTDASPEHLKKLKRDAEYYEVGPHVKVAKWYAAGRRIAPGTVFAVQSNVPSSELPVAYQDLLEVLSEKRNYESLCSPYNEVTTSCRSKRQRLEYHQNETKRIRQELERCEADLEHYERATEEARSELQKMKERFDNSYQKHPTV